MSQDLPLDLVVLADLGAGDDHAEIGRLHRLDADGLAPYMAAVKPAATLANGAQLTFEDLRAFRPESLAARLPEAAALVTLRQKVSQRGLEKRELEELIATLPAGSALRAGLEAAARGGAASAAPAASPTPAPAPPAAPRVDPPLRAPAARAAGDPLDALFDMVDLPGDAPSPMETPVDPAPAPAPRPAAASSHALDKLVAMLGAGASGTQATSATQAALARVIDETLGELVRAALHDPAFQAVERTWTALRFLVRRIDFRSGIRLWVLPTTRARLAAHVRDVLGPFAEDERREARVVVALADFELAGDPAGLALAGEVAAAAAATRTPLVAGLDPALLGIPSLGKVEYIENVDDLLAADTHAEWNALRARDESRWLALVANRFLLRLPYGAESDKVRTFAFEENDDRDEPMFLWGLGTWVIGAQIAASFVRTGWGVDLTGTGEDVALGDLPVRLMRLRTGEIVPAPLEAMLSERRALEFAQAGIVALLCKRGGDAAFLAIAPMVKRLPNAAELRGSEGRRDSLPHALLVAHVAAWVAHLESQGRIAPDARAETLARGIQFLSMNAQGPTLEASVEGNAVRVSPWRDPLRGLPDFVVPLDRTS